MDAFTKYETFFPRYELSIISVSYCEYLGVKNHFDTEKNLFLGVRINRMSDKRK